MFGHTNPLAGPDWARAFTNAIKTGTIEWWDPAQKAFRHDNPLFIPIDQKSVLIIPSDRAEHYLTENGIRQ